MADLDNTVVIIFKADSKDAAEKIAAVERALANIKPNEDTKKASDDIASVGKASSITAIAAEDLGGKLRDLARDAGAPEPILKALDGTLLKIGRPVTGTAVIAAAAVLAFGVAAAKTGIATDDFVKSVGNVGGQQSIDAERALRFVLDAVSDLETDLEDTLALYKDFLISLAGTGVDAKTAEDAFRGIVAAVDAVDGDAGDAERALKAFVDVAKDGKIDVKDLDTNLRAIPGGLEILSNALGVPIDDLRDLAKAGLLGKTELGLLAQALNDTKYADNVSPVDDAFNDLWNTLKLFAIDLGVGGAVNVGLTALEAVVRAVAVAVTTSLGVTTLFGQTLANVAFTLANPDEAGGFLDRQNDALETFTGAIGKAIEKIPGLGTELQNAEAKAQPASTAYAEMAAALKNVGGEASTAKEDVNLFAGDVAKYEAAQESANAETDKSAAALKAQAKESKDAKDAADKLTIELEKLASNEKIKAMEFKVQLDIAQLQEDTKRVEAAFTSINEVIGSTNDLMGDLFGILANPNLEWAQIRAIEDQIAKENDIKKGQLDLQRKLIEAQVANLNAQTAQIQKGDALIKVDGAGLQPHLEGFMWEILRTIQVRVNRDGLNLLLGV